jgi:hypothetical protein
MAARLAHSAMSEQSRRRGGDTIMMDVGCERRAIEEDLFCQRTMNKRLLAQNLWVKRCIESRSTIRDAERQQ